MTVNVYSLAADGNTKISAHFHVREFRSRDGTDPVFISPQLVEILEKIRVHFGQSVTVDSGYRTVAYNKKLPNSSPKSQHCNGLAADIKVKNCTPAAVAAYAETLLPNTGGIGTYSTFVHVDVRAKKSRWKG